MWTILGTILPGAGLIKAGRRVSGGLVLGSYLIAVLGLVGVAVFNPSLIVGLAVDSYFVAVLAVVLGIGAVVWPIVITASHLNLRPAAPTVTQRVIGSIFVGILCFAVGTPMAVASRLCYDHSSLLGSVFKTDDSDSVTRPNLDTANPWKDKSRLNILILGGDSGKKRNINLGIRTDTVIVASIDTRTGQTITFSLPRNTARMPFPKDSILRRYYPKGFYDGSNPENAEYFLNSMYNNVPGALGEDILGPTDNVGADVLKLSVGAALGLDIDYYVLVDMDGFVDIIDALGGITVNINERVPIGGDTAKDIEPSRWLEIGPEQHLNGQDALWYARGRWGTSDYHRMDRQRCVINAVIDQADPFVILTRYEALSEAGKKTILTDIPGEMLPAFTKLALVVKQSTMHSLVFKNAVDGFSSSHPDFDLVRLKVATAIADLTAQPTPATTLNPGAATPAGTQTTPASTTSGTATPPASSENADDVCAYHPGD